MIIHTFFNLIYRINWIKKLFDFFGYYIILDGLGNSNKLLWNNKSNAFLMIMHIGFIIIAEMLTYIFLICLMGLLMGIIYIILNIIIMFFQRGKKLFILNSLLTNILIIGFMLLISSLFLVHDPLLEMIISTIVISLGTILIVFGAIYLFCFCTYNIKYRNVKSNTSIHDIIKEIYLLYRNIYLMIFSLIVIIFYFSSFGNINVDAMYVSKYDDEFALEYAIYIPMSNDSKIMYEDICETCVMSYEDIPLDKFYQLIEHQNIQYYDGDYYIEKISGNILDFLEYKISYYFGLTFEMNFFAISIIMHIIISVYIFFLIDFVKCLLIDKKQKSFENNN